MVDEQDVGAAKLLREMLLENHSELGTLLHLDESTSMPSLVLSVPRHPGHTLSIEICRTEATISYSDGQLPGPAEELYVWGGAPIADGVGEVCEQVERLIRGEVLLVRQRLSWVVRLLRRGDCDSFLWFVRKDEIERWPARRRRSVLRIWSWDGADSAAFGAPDAAP